MDEGGRADGLIEHSVRDSTIFMRRARESKKQKKHNTPTRQPSCFINRQCRGGRNLTMKAGEAITSAAERRLRRQQPPPPSPPPPTTTTRFCHRRLSWMHFTPARKGRRGAPWGLETDISRSRCRNASKPETTTTKRRDCQRDCTRSSTTPETTTTTTTTTTTKKEGTHECLVSCVLLSKGCASQARCFVHIAIFVVNRARLGA